MKTIISALLFLLIAYVAHAQTYQYVRQWGSFGSGNGQFKDPIGLAIDHDGNVYVGDDLNNRIQKFTSTGSYITQFAKHGGDGYNLGVAVDTLNNIYVANASTNRIEKLDSLGNFLTEWNGGGTEVGGAFTNPWGIAVDSVGNVYVADSYQNRIMKFSSNGTYVTQWGNYGNGDGQFNAPQGITIDGDGNVFVADYGNGRIQKFNSNGGFIAKYGQNAFFWGIAVDSDGNMYGAEALYNRIQKFSSTGVFITQWGSSGCGNGQFSYPYGIAVDGAGNVYVADLGNNRIQVFAPGPPSIFPSITSFFPTSSSIGNTVTIRGVNFTNATTVSFGGISTTFSLINDTTITAIVPLQSPTGSTSISVNTQNGLAKSCSPFIVISALIVDIPDVNFKAVLIANTSIDTNGDKEIQESEAQAVTVLDVSGYSISDMTGLEAFTGLISLFCINNQLTKLDISHINSLATFNCTSNPGLTKICINNSQVNYTSSWSKDATTTYSTTCDNSWVGSNGNDWNSGSNWSSGSVPQPTDTVTIPSGSAPVITGSVSIAGLTMATGSNLTVNGTLSVAGNLTDNGSITGSGTIILNGSNQQNISGSDTFNSNITIDNSAGVIISSPFTISGYINLTSGTLTTNNNLTIDLDNGGIAFKPGDAGSLSGNVNLSKDISKTYHIFAAPTGGITKANLLSNFTTSDFYTYNEADHTKTDINGFYQGWETVTANLLKPTQAYAIYFPVATVVTLTGTYDHYWHDTIVTLRFTPTSPVPNTSHDGWNLLGNPYPSSLDWDQLTTTLANKSIYYYDAAQSKYIAYNSGIPVNGNIIPSAQGFWVQASATGEKVTFSNTARATTGPNTDYYRIAASSDNLKLSVSSGIKNDETYFRFDNNATLNFDGSLDSRKWMNGDSTPSLYSVLGIEKYSINSIPYPGNGLRIPLKVKAAFNGTYAFKGENIGSFNASVNVSLEDRLLNVTQDLRANPVYNYSAIATDTAQRFFIVFREAATATTINPSVVFSSVQIKGINNQIEVDFLSTNTTIADLLVYNILGEKLYQAQNITTASGSYKFNAGQKEEGIYIVKVVNNQGVYTSKIYLAK